MIKIRKIAKITSLLMAFMLLLSSTGFSIDLHFCQGNIKSFSLFGTAKSCHAKAEKSHCQKASLKVDSGKTTCHSVKSTLEKADDCERDCCSNESIVVSPDMDTQKVLSKQLTETNISFISAFVAVFYAGQTLDLAKDIIPHLNYIPPLLDQDIPVLIQSFLL